MEYALLVSDELEDLEQMVTEMLSKGCLLYGNPVVNLIGRGEWSYHQAVIKETNCKECINWDREKNCHGMECHGCKEYCANLFVERDSNANE